MAVRLNPNMIEVRIPNGDPGDTSIEADLMSMGYEPIHSGAAENLDETIVFVIPKDSE